MTKDKSSKPKSKSGNGKPFKSNNGCTLRFKPPQQSETTIKAKFLDEDDTEISEIIHVYDTGDDHANLIALMNQIVGLGDLYDLWTDKTKRLAQTMSRALNDQVREEWQTIISQCADWEQANMKDIFIQYLRELATQVLGPKAFKNQSRAMEDGELRIPENDLRTGTYRLFQINRLLPYIGIYARSYTIEELNKIIVKSLTPLAKRKYIELGGDDLDDQSDILELMTQLDTKFRLKKQYALENEKAEKSHGSKHNGNNGKSNGANSGNKGDKKGPNPCRRHDGAHDYKDCPDNKANRNKDKDGKGDKKKGDLHSAKSDSAPAKSNKSTPSVRFGKPAKESKSDLTYDSDDASAMMVHTTTPQLNGITIITVPTSDGDRLGTTILLDNGFTGYAMISYPFAKQLGFEFTEIKGSTYRTTNGELNTSLQLTLDDVRLPHLSRTRSFTATFEVAPENSGDFGYGMLMGTQMMDDLGIDQSRTSKTITWGPDVEVPMVPSGYWTNARILALADQPTSSSKDIQLTIGTQQQIEAFATTNISTYTEAVYNKPDLKEIVTQDCSHLTDSQQQALLQVLTANEAVFQGCKGNYTGAPVGITLKEDAKPFRAFPYPVPLKNRETLEAELRRQCTIGAMRRLSPDEYEAREWAFPAFGTPKKDGSIRLVIDFRRLNSQLVRKEYPLPTTEEILMSIQGFLYASSLDLNMGYLSIPLNENTRQILTIIMPFGAYECLMLPMGVMPATDIFQARMVHLFADMDERKPHPYIDDIIHFKGNTFEEHLEILNEILQLLAKAGMQVNAKSKFCQTTVKFLGFELSRTGYKPLKSRVDAILRLLPPTNLKQVRGFLGVINFIKNHIPNRAAICEPITRLTRKDVPFKWGEEQQTAFEKIKAIVSESIMLTYPNPNRPFDLYPDASSKYAMGALLIQDDNVVSTFSRKFNEAQLKYTVTGQELLAAAEACKHFAPIIRGCDIRIHTDHLNLTHDDTVHANLREQRTRIFLDSEFAPLFVHIAGEENTGADGLSRLPMSDDDDTPEIAMDHIFAISHINRDTNEDFPLDMKQIRIAQQNDEILQRRITSRRYDNNINTVTLDGNIVYTFNGKVWVPKELQRRIVTWYHENLQHAGVTRTLNSISQTFAWKGLRTMVEEHIASCDSCQRNKQSNKKQYGKLPLVPALRNREPWEKVQVDCCGPWTIRYHNALTGKISKYEIHLLSMVDVCTGWSEFTRLNSHTAIAVAKAFDKTWLCRYPRPLECGHDNGVEFLGMEFQEMLISYGIKSKPTTVKNPTANSIVERIQGTLGEQLRSTIFEADWSDDIDTLIQSCAYALRATAPSNNPYSPAQLAFGCDMIFRQKIIVDWELLKAQRNKQAVQNNAKENKKRLEHEYKVGQLVLIVYKPYERRNNPKISPTTYASGPYRILEIYGNGNVKLQRDNYTDIINIRRLTPYYAREE